MCAFYAPEDSTCFAVTISNQFSTLDVEEVRLDIQLQEPPDPTDLVPLPQLQPSNRRKIEDKLLQLMRIMYPEVCKEVVNLILPVDSVSPPFSSAFTKSPKYPH